MDQWKEFFGKTECHFNWGLSQVDVNRVMPMVAKLRDKMDEKDDTDDSTSIDKWPLKLTYGYELFSEDPAGAEKVVEEVIKEIETSKESLNVKYRVPFLHVALSVKACMMLQKGTSRLKDVEGVAGVKPVSAMSDLEMSGLLAIKAQIFRYYGPDGTNKSEAWLREAVNKNRNEVEWKISLVITFNRKRHFFKGADVEWNQIEETVNILEEVLCCSDLTVKQVVKCKYMLAVAYHDYGMGKKYSAQIEECRRNVLQLCKEFHDLTEHPQYVTFCAERFAQAKGPETRKGMEIINKFLDKFPNHVGVHTTACKILKRQNRLAEAAKHAQIAMDLGGFGASWLWLECKTKLNQRIDAEAFFDKLLSQFQEMYKTSIHMNASLYYFCSKRDPVKGAYHMEQALIEDPKFHLLHKPTFCGYAPRGKNIPVEVAYNQIMIALRSHHSRDDVVALNSAKLKIEEECDVKKFCTSQNLVEQALGKSRFSSY